MSFSFITAAAKHLSLVEISSWNSNQHEFNGVAPLKRMFGLGKQEYDATYVYFDNTGSCIQDSGSVTWYDARENHPSRSEYRLYYSENSVVRRAAENDLLVVGKKEDGSIVIIVAENGSSYYNLCMTLFGLQSHTANYVLSNNIAI